LESEHIEGFRPPNWPPDGVIIEINLFALDDDPEPNVRPMEDQPSKANKLPENVVPPASAMRTKSGLLYAIVRDGAGPKPANPREQMTLELSAWQLDLGSEQIFDGLTLNLSPERAPGGLGEVLTQAKVGGLVRVWVPADRAGSVFPGREGSQLLLDIYLRSIP
jgi:hypothetical protein